MLVLTVPMGDSAFHQLDVLPGTLPLSMSLLLLVAWLLVLLVFAVHLGSLLVSFSIKPSEFTHCIANTIPDKKRQLLKEAADPPGSKTPLDFDLYTLNHAAKVGELEVAWIAEFEKELDRQKIFVSPGTAAFNHFAFFKSKPIARKMSDESSMIIFASQSLEKLNHIHFVYLQNPI